MKINPKVQKLLDRFGGWIPVALFLILGILVLVRPTWAYRLIIYGVAIACGICGVLNLLHYFREKPLPHTQNYALALGLALILVTGVIMIWPLLVIDLAISLLGLTLCGQGFTYLQTAFDTKRVHAQRWWIYLIAAAAMVICGILTFLLPQTTVLIGILLLLAAVGCAALLIFRKWIEEPANPARPVVGPDAGAAVVPPMPEADGHMPPPPPPEHHPHPEEMPPRAEEAAPADTPDEAHEAPTMDF